jgi:hypothetical protein
VVYSRSGSGERRYLLEEIRQKIGAKEVVLIGHSEQEMPTLVIKGRCDYLSWSSAQEYWGIARRPAHHLDGSGHKATRGWATLTSRRSIRTWLRDA